MASSSPSSSDEFELDPVFLNSRREAVVIFGLWFLCSIWAVPVSYMMGYGQEVVPGNVPTIFGMPTWIFWGIVCPWLVADVVTTWLCFRYIRNDDLGVSPEELAESAGTSNEAASGDATAKEGV
jgi:hypothetical protein